MALKDDDTTFVRCCFSFVAIGCERRENFGVQSRYDNLS
jgi:hypothetical protein